ncbi:MAG: response regulator [Bacteroidales bacterium]|nr:response regulator [Bacteroidales bacterium]
MKKGSNRRILLIIDDDKSTRMLIKDILEDTGILIMESVCGEKAYELIKNYREKIGLVLLDIWLPDCDGWSLIGSIRQLDQKIPVIAISAILPSELAEKYQLAGFTGYISKPFKVDELQEVIISYFSGMDNR